MRTHVRSCMYIMLFIRTTLTAAFIDMPMFYINYLTLHNLLMYAGTIRSLWYGLWLCRGDNPLTKANGLSSLRDAHIIQTRYNLKFLQFISFLSCINIQMWMVGCTNSRPRNAVGNVSGNRCESDCRSRGREFDPGPVPYFRGDWSWNNFYGHTPSFHRII